jgi:CMP-2-keto-3-deoxyoctulosonic acid synthetase
VDRCCVATDDDRVASAVEALGARVVRVPATRGGSAERCAAAYGELRRRANATQEDADFDVVVAVDCDEAFVEAHHIERVADAVVNSDAEIATLCRPSRGEEVRRSADGAPTSPPKHSADAT